MARRNIRICGLLVPPSSKPQSYGGGHIYPGARDIGSYVQVSKTTALRLLSAVQARPRLPRWGYEVKLCNDTWLRRRGSSFEVQRNASGGFKGLAGSVRRKRRR